MASPNKKRAQSRPEGGFALRVFPRKGRGKRMARFLIRCGCCDEKVQIYYADDTLEINGVIASVENWRVILLPLLRPDQQPAS